MKITKLPIELVAVFVTIGMLAGMWFGLDLIPIDTLRQNVDSGYKGL